MAREGWRLRSWFWFGLKHVVALAATTGVLFRLLGYCGGAARFGCAIKTHSTVLGQTFGPVWAGSLAVFLAFTYADKTGADKVNRRHGPQWRGWGHVFTGLLLIPLGSIMAMNAVATCHLASRGLGILAACASVALYLGIGFFDAWDLARGLAAEAEAGTCGQGVSPVAGCCETDASSR